MHSSVSVLQSAVQLAVQEAGEKKKMTEGEYGEKVRSKDSDSLRVFLCLLFLCDLLYSVLVETEESVMAC